MRILFAAFLTIGGICSLYAASDGKVDKIQQKLSGKKNVRLKVTAKDTKLSGNLKVVENLKKKNKKDKKSIGDDNKKGGKNEDKVDERKDKKETPKKVEKKDEKAEKSAKLSRFSQNIEETIKELEVHINNQRLDSRNRSFFRKLLAEFLTLQDYIEESKKKDVDVDIIMAYINITVDDIYFIVAENNTVGISDIVKQTISEILFKTIDGKIALEWLKDVSDID